jgi:iron complex transport system substrate-binding protein
MPTKLRRGRSGAALAFGLTLGLALAAAPAGARCAPRVISFDQCADQYVLALSPRSAIVGLSTKADDADSLLRERARGLPLRRVDLETALAARPQLAVRTYGGDRHLLDALRRRGVRVLTLDDADDFDGIRRNIRTAAAALGEVAAGEALIADMDRRLAASAGAWKGRSAVFLTPSGFTAGPGTLFDAILRAAGLVNAERRPGYGEVPLEQFVLAPPDAVVLAFFDTSLYASESWAPARHALMRRLIAQRAIASLPGATVDCASWGAAQAVEQLAARAPK